MAPDWSHLPVDLLAIIAGDFTELGDVARFGSVCTSWRTGAADAIATLPPQLPWLVLPSSRFFSFIENKIYSNLLLTPNTSGRRRRLFASPHGWTLAIDSDRASLLHPFTSASIPLPKLPDYFAETDDLLFDWSPHGVMASCGETVVFAALGSDKWDLVANLRYRMVSSINYSDGVFVIFEEGVCITTVVDAESLNVLSIIQRPNTQLDTSKARVVVTDADLLLLVEDNWMMVFGVEETEFSRVFRAEHRGEQPVQWQEVVNIGDRAVFVDALHGFAVDAKVFPRVQRNSIYSVRSEEVQGRYGRSDNGMKYEVSVYNLEDKSSKQLACRLNQLVDRSAGEQPTWILPKLG